MLSTLTRDGKVGEISVIYVIDIPVISSDSFKNSLKDVERKSLLLCCSDNDILIVLICLRRTILSEKSLAARSQTTILLGGILVRN